MARGSYQADYLTSIDQEISDWFKILLLTKAEIVIMLFIKFGLVRWLSKSDSI